MNQRRGMSLTVVALAIVLLVGGGSAAHRWLHAAAPS